MGLLNLKQTSSSLVYYEFSTTDLGLYFLVCMYNVQLIICLIDDKLIKHFIRNDDCSIVRFIYNTYKQGASSCMQNQQNIEKSFFQQLKPGDYIDARFGDDDWKLAKVIDKQNKYLSLIYDGYSPNNQQVFFNPLRVKPLRAVTVAYTGPSRGVYATITSIPQLSKHIAMIDTILKSTQPPSAYKITQYLRGELFTGVNSLLMSDFKLSAEQITTVNTFFLHLLDQIGKICLKAKQYLPEYFQANANNKFIYLVNHKIALIYSLQELLYLVNAFLASGNDTPKLLKMYKNQISQQNLFNHMKKYLKIITQLCAANDSNGRWLPTFTRLQLSKILLKYKQQQSFFSIAYDIKDYLEFYSYWPAIMQICSTKFNEQKFIHYILTVMIKQSPFDSKLKSLIILKKVLQKQIKLNFVNVNAVIELINRKNIVDSLLKYFNPEIFKRYIPILKIASQQSKKTFTQTQIDDLFKIMKTCHDSEVNLIYEIIVSISEFISIDTLDNIYIDIQKNIDINSETGVRFVRDFTIRAIQNFNNNKNKGFINLLIGRKKNSSKFGYYGLDLLCREILDGPGKILPKNIAFAISNISAIFEKEVFQHERYGYMQNCITNINKRQSYGQSVKLLHQIICTYPSSAIISESHQSIVVKLDDKYKLVDTLIKGLKPLEKQCNGQTSKNPNIIKVDFLQSLKYFYNFIEQFSSYFKYSVQLAHINYLWHMPHIFQFLRKSKQNQDREIPSWKKKYYKKISNQMIKGILNEILKKKQNLIPSQQCFDAIDQLILSYNMNKSIELTERATIRYINLSQVFGLNFYFEFLDKMIALNKDQWRQFKYDGKNSVLTRKVIKKIFQIHLRPQDYQGIDLKCENWMNCLMKVIRSLHKESGEICVGAIEQFLQLIRGRQFKDISGTGKIDIIVECDNKQKTVTLQRNATILKLRQSIMEIYKIKWNFGMYNKAMKREVTFVEEEDFSVNAMGHSIKGPTISIRRIEQGEKYPQFEAVDRFMSNLELVQQFYTIVFGLLKKESDKNLHQRIWKLIQKIPVNKAVKNKIQNCNNFTKKDWEQFLLPGQMEQLQYSINIVYSLMTTSKWMQEFKKTKGTIVIQQLYLTMLGSKEPLTQKIIINLSKILLKILEHTPAVAKEQKKQQSKSQILQKQLNFQNLDKISRKIMLVLQQQIKFRQLPNSQPVPQGYSTQYLNLMMKILLTSSLKQNCPQIQILIKFFLHDKVLLQISNLILFQSKDNDTQFFTEDILQKIVLHLNLQKSYKIQVFKQFVVKFLVFQQLKEKKSTENYFIFLIDFIHSMDKQQAKTMYEQNSQIVQYIKSYIEETVGCIVNQNQQEQKKSMINQQMINGSFKLLNQTFCFSIFGFNEELLFTRLLDNYVLSQKVSKIGKEEKLSQISSSKTKIKYKKILYDIIKKMIFQNEKLLDIFVHQMTPRLQNAEWRRNIYSSWSLEQQKREKKIYCGLENLAATCYINCLFQQLFMIKRFTDRFINIDSLSYKQSPEANQIYQLQKLLTYLKYGNKRSYTTRPFCQSFITYEGVPIDPTVQNDADEFFNALMEKIQSFLKLSGHHYILEDTFQGKLSNQLNCEGCPHSSQKIQPFMSIGLDIKNKKTLEQALDGYVEGEILDGDNAYYCEKCDKKVRTMKRLCIKQVPNILVIVLKRFTYNFDEMRKIKINDQLKFPQELNVKKYTSEFNLGEECKVDDYYDYKLRGVVVHAGTSEGGHYYSFIKEEQKESNPKWFQFNDEIIEQTEYKRIQQDSYGGQQKDSQFKSQKYKNAYILFYEKQKQILHKNPQNTVQQQKPIQRFHRQQTFQDQLAQLVKSENRNADFLSIILDQLFIRLCESITMCGQEKAYHFMMLYFHVVLLRDRNKEEYLANIYRIILTLMNSNKGFSLWYIHQINHHYVRQFLIEAPRLTKYLCLGFIFQAIKTLNKSQKLSVKNLQNQNRIIKQQKTKKEILKKPIVQIEKINQDKQIKQNERAKKQIQVESQQKLEPKTSQQEAKGQMGSSQQLEYSSSDVQKQIVETDIQLQKQNSQQKQKLQFQHIEINHAQIDQQRYDGAILNLLSCLVFCMKKKGMTPFAKIFTFLSGIPKYKKRLVQLEYPDRVYDIVIEDRKIARKTQYQHNQSYFGRENSACKEKDLETSFTFLVESLRYYPGTLSKQNITNLLAQANSRPTTKTLIYLLAKTSKNSQQVFQNLQEFESKLKNDKYKREDVEKYLFMIRYYYLLADGQTNASSIKDMIELAESVKTICINSLTTNIKEKDSSYLFMELLIVQLNKLAFKSQNFKKSWISKVGGNQGLAKSLENWVSESNRPHFLDKCDQWKKKTSNLSYVEKDSLIKRNRQIQQKRTYWMLSQRKNRKQGKTYKNEDSENTEQQSNQNNIQKQKQDSQVEVSQIHSDLDTTEINKQIAVGFKQFRIRQRLGILTKVEDDKGVCKWAILERGQIETYIDF